MLRSSGASGIDGPPIGVTDLIPFKNSVVEVPAFARLLLYSDGAVEVGLEDLLLVARVLRMLLPDEWIASGREEGVEVDRAQRTQLDQLADEGRLKVEGHSSEMLPLRERC